jgi:hypothetical protein
MQSVDASSTDWRKRSFSRSAASRSLRSVMSASTPTMRMTRPLSSRTAVALLWVQRIDPSGRRIRNSTS